MLSRHQFDRIRRLALNLAGIELANRHRELLAHRCSRLGITGSEGLESVLDAAEREEPAATQKLLGLLTTKFTRFFRHPRHFEVCAHHVTRKAQEGTPSRVWSAGCATGQEPYSIAIALLEAFPRQTSPVTIVATDIDEQAIAFARRGEYRDSALEGLDDERRRRFFCCSKKSGSWLIEPEVWRMVEFGVVNLAAVDWAVQGPFEIIFCRNVLMYLEACYRYSALERMASFLSPGGLLIVDPTEHLGKAGHWFSPGGQGIYFRQETVLRPRHNGEKAFGKTG